LRRGPRDHHRAHRRVFSESHEDPPSPPRTAPIHQFSLTSPRRWPNYARRVRALWVSIFSLTASRVRLSLPVYGDQWRSVGAYVCFKMDCCAVVVAWVFVPRVMATRTPLVREAWYNPKDRSLGGCDHDPNNAAKLYDGRPNSAVDETSPWPGARVSTPKAIQAPEIVRRWLPPFRFSQPPVQSTRGARLPALGNAGDGNDVWPTPDQPWATFVIGSLQHPDIGHSRSARWLAHSHQNAGDTPRLGGSAASSRKSTQRAQLRDRSASDRHRHRMAPHFSGPQGRLHHERPFAERPIS